MVFQGTVLGPCLWNVFFKDVNSPLLNTPFRETKYADDLSIHKPYRTTTPNDNIHYDLRQCQSTIHTWGTANGVSFDPKKEEFSILHPHFGSGPTFRLLGPLIDAKLTMHDSVDKTLSKARPKLKAPLRTIHMYS